MQTPRDTLTPEALAMLQTIGSTGSFAAAARALGLVPSALTYRVRQIEDALDVLLFDRSSRQARMTEAGAALSVSACVPVARPRTPMPRLPEVSMTTMSASSVRWMTA